VLDKNEINIFKNNKCIIKGKRNKADGLWDIPLQPIPNIISEPSREIQHTANAIICKSQAKTELAEYLYGCCGSPAVSTFIHAIKNGNFLSWPGIESVSFTKHLPPSIDSAKGHLDQEQKNLQSTKVLEDSPEMKQEQADFFPPSDSPNVKTHDAIAAIVPFTTKNTTYQDLTGRFPHKSTRGNEYILIVYDHDSSCILHPPL